MLLEKFNQICTERKGLQRKILALRREMGRNGADEKCESELRQAEGELKVLNGRLRAQLAGIEAEELREVMELGYLYDFSVTEMSKSLSVARSTCYRRLRKAKECLQ